MYNNLISYSIKCLVSVNVLNIHYTMPIYYVPINAVENELKNCFIEMKIVDKLIFNILKIIKKIFFLSVPR